VGQPAGVASALHNLAEAARYAGDAACAVRLDEEALGLFGALGLEAQRAHPLHNLGMLALAAGDGARAAGRGGLGRGVGGGSGHAARAGHR
jgi:hypothetical protein